MNYFSLGLSTGTEISRINAKWLIASLLSYKSSTQYPSQTQSDLQQKASLSENKHQHITSISEPAFVHGRHSFSLVLAFCISFFFFHQAELCKMSRCTPSQTVAANGREQ
jgi:hypothetical protein